MKFLMMLLMKLVARKVLVRAARQKPRLIRLLIRLWMILGIKLLRTGFTLVFLRSI